MKKYRLTWYRLNLTTSMALRGKTYHSNRLWILRLLRWLGKGVNWPYAYEAFIAERGVVLPGDIKAGGNVIDLAKKRREYARYTETH